MGRIPNVVVAVFALAAAPMANATAFDVTYTGTVVSDQYGNFLANGQSATGDPFSLTFVVDGPVFYTDPLVGQNAIFGQYAADPIQATITIAGQSFSTSHFQ